MKHIAERYISTLITSPEFFSDRPSRNLALLFPDFAKKLKKAFQEYIKIHPKFTPYVVEGFRPRSVAEANAEAGSGIKDSMHCYGIAADLAFKYNGKHTYNGNYDDLRKCLKDAGLVLIGKNDIGHVQYIPVKDQNAFRKVVNQAVKDFQKKHGLTIDGIVGKKTIGKARSLTWRAEKPIEFKDIKAGLII